MSSELQQNIKDMTKAIEIDITRTNPIRLNPI